MSTSIEKFPVLAEGNSIGIHSTRNLADQKVVPSIVRHLTQFTVPLEILKAEQERYARRAAIKPPSAEEKAIRVAHDALLNGRVLVDIQTLLVDRHESMGYPYPVLGLARPRDRQVTCRMYANGLVEFLVKHRVIFSVQTPRTFPGSNVKFQRVSRIATVPPLPPELADVKLHDGHVIVWEATWVNNGGEKTVNLDPALLEHVAGSLYAVVAVWDLSPVEAAILGPQVRGR